MDPIAQLEALAAKGELTDDGYYDLAIFYYDSERWADSIAAFRSYALRRPNESEPHYNIGLVYLNELDRYDDAEAAFRTASELNPTDPNPWVMLGKSRFFAGRTPAAIAAWRRAESLGPEEGTPKYLLGLGYHWQGDYSAAVAKYNEAKAADPSLDISLKRGMALHANGRAEEAIVDYRASVTNDPSNADALLHLAWAYAQIGDQVAARGACEQIDGSSPDEGHRCTRLIAKVADGSFTAVPRIGREADLRPVVGPPSVLNVQVGTASVPLSVERGAALQVRLGIDGTLGTPGWRPIAELAGSWVFSKDSAVQLPVTLSQLGVADDGEYSVLMAQLVGGVRGRAGRFAGDFAAGPVFQRYDFGTVIQEDSKAVLDVNRWGVVAEAGLAVAVNRHLAFRGIVAYQGVGLFMDAADTLTAEPEQGFTIGLHGVYGF